MYNISEFNILRERHFYTCLYREFEVVNFLTETIYCFKFVDMPMCTVKYFYL